LSECEKPVFTKGQSLIVWDKMWALCYGVVVPGLKANVIETFTVLSQLWPNYYCTKFHRNTLFLGVAFSMISIIRGMSQFYDQTSMVEDRSWGESVVTFFPRYNKGKIVI
jgi:hypothetical protein